MCLHLYFNILSQLNFREFIFTSKSFEMALNKCKLKGRLLWPCSFNTDFKQWGFKGIFFFIILNRTQHHHLPKVKFLNPVICSSLLPSLYSFYSSTVLETAELAALDSGTPSLIHCAFDNNLLDFESNFLCCANIKYNCNHFWLSNNKNIDSEINIEMVTMPMFSY